MLGLLKQHFYILYSFYSLTKIRKITKINFPNNKYYTHLTALCLGLLRWAGTRKAKPIWILLKPETVSGSGFSWAICKSAPRSRQITMPAPHHSVFYRPDALPATQPTASKYWRHSNKYWHPKDIKYEMRLNWLSSWAAHSQVRRHQLPVCDSHFWWMLTAVSKTNSRCLTSQEL